MWTKPRNYKASEEAQVHQSGEQEQLVGRRVRTPVVRDLCAKKDGERKTRARVTTDRDGASPGGPDELLRNSGIVEKQQGCVAAAARARKRPLDEFIKKRKTFRYRPKTRKGRTVHG
ncbi:hypothetical protein M514_26777 [Trichuris suis]|uniref:Uncharacterized protein n=1 Tax=Trichuris suis TaxID=68888 RepID=A0A085MV29_9BILA|nr:hypothetical protein M514_26777 [Trichuris suis]